MNEKGGGAWWQSCFLLFLNLGFAGPSGRRSGRLEGDLEDAVAQGVAVEGLNGDEGLVVIGHGDESESFALVGLEIADHLDGLDGSEWAKELPEYALLRVGRQIVHEDAPTCPFIEFEVDICVFCGCNIGQLEICAL